MFRAEDTDTISAVATPMGEGGIGIVRLSGPESTQIAGRLFLARSGGPVAAQKSFRAVYGRVISEEEGRKRTVDEALVLVMRAPHSYTGEDVVEIQAHGGPAVLHAILELTVKHGARPARPGEFTKRAFLNGRIDLTQAEAVLDLIRARSDRSARWAASQLEGRLSRKIGSLKERLLGVLANLEAAVDFPEDFPETDSLKETETKLAVAEEELKNLLEGADLGLLVKRGLTVALWGRPNVGKSSLLNALTRTDRVIVTPIPGTTRDVVEEEALLGGFPVRFQDTAGIQESLHPVEKESIERSRKAMAAADLVLFVLDSSRPFSPEDQKMREEISEKPAIFVLNKSDLPRRLDPARLLSENDRTPVIFCSCVKDGGEEGLRKEILRFMTQGQVEISQEPVVSSVRQKEHLEAALGRVRQARQACRERLSFEFIASDVRRALDSLGAVVGELVTDDVLELLFSKFCIGK
jgi:tRNA modification GTPase